MNWRSRYEPFLKSAQSAGERASIYGYPFLDGTTGGIEQTNTYGRRYFGHGALGLWTDARPIELGPPQGMGLPDIDEAAGLRRYTLEAWVDRALKEPAGGEPRYVLTGHYIDGEEPSKVALKIVPADRSGPADALPEVLFEAIQAVAQDYGYFQLAELQRRAGRAMTERLIELGIAGTRRPLAGGLDHA